MKKKKREKMKYHKTPKTNKNTKRKGNVTGSREKTMNKKRKKSFVNMSDNKRRDEITITRMREKLLFF